MADVLEEAGKRRESLKAFCSSCTRNGKSNEAQEYCLKCEEFFCVSCLEPHNAVLSNHPTKDINDYVPNGASSETNLPSEICEEHLKIVDLYCQDKDVVGCATCMVIGHGSCRHIYIPKSTVQLMCQIELDPFRLKLAEIITNFETIHKKQNLTMVALEEDLNNCLKEIDVHHQSLVMRVDDIVNASKVELQQSFGSMAAELEKHTQSIDKSLSELNDSVIMLDNNAGNNAQLFIEIKKCDKVMNASEHILEASLTNLNTQGLAVTIDTQLEELLAEMKTFVKAVHRTPSQVLQKRNVDASKWRWEACQIVGCTVLSDGTVLLADFGSKKLKRLDGKTLILTEQLSLGAEPQAVCRITKEEAAVSQSGKQVAFVSLTPKLAHLRTLFTEHECVGVAYSQGKLFVTDGKQSLYVYGKNDSLLQNVTTDRSGFNIFPMIRDVAVSDRGDRIFVADHIQGLITLDREARVLDKSFCDKILSAQSLCSDGMGGLFLCGWESNNVVHIGHRGNILGEMLSAGDGIENPMCLAFDPTNLRLFVCQWKRGDKDLLAFDLR